ncbi:MAG TPA: TlpA disulfide reductase family protein [Terriglobia bacterium]|nr:TlpA disulfide reductase family protein [Terriglobia bacterium]
MARNYNCCVRQPLFALCGIVLLSSCVGKEGPAARARPELIAMEDAPDFVLKNVADGSPFHSSQLKGKIVVVDFWATWCVPCKMEIPYYNQLREQMKNRDVEFLGLTFESGDSIEAVAEFVQDLEMRYPVLMGTDDVADAFGGHSVYPTTFLVGKDWKIYRKFYGGSPDKIQDLKLAIESLLDQNDLRSAPDPARRVFQDNGSFR